VTAELVASLARRLHRGGDVDALPEDLESHLALLQPTGWVGAALSVAHVTVGPAHREETQMPDYNARAVNEHDSNVRMPTARCITDPPGGLLSAWEAIELRRSCEEEGHQKPKFRCLKCLAWVHPVSNNRTETRRGGEPFFARNRSRKTGPSNAHAAFCTFAFSHRVRELQKESGGALTRRVEEGQVIYRLSLPKTFAPSDRDGGGSSPNPEDQEFILEVTKVLNTAIKVTQMLAEFEEVGATVEADFRATCDGMDVRWLDFLYTPRRLITLARRIETNGPLAHPVAAIINPSRRPKSSKIQGKWWIHAGIPRPDGDDGERSAFVYAPDPDWLPEPGPRGCVGYGMWNLGSARNGYERSLCLTLPDRDCIAALPGDLTPRRLDAWASGALLRSAETTPEEELEETPEE